MAKLFNSKGLTFITSNFYQLINFNNAIKNLQEPSNRPQNRKPGPANPNPVQKHKKPGPPHQRNTPLAIFLNKSIKTYKTILYSTASNLILKLFFALFFDFLAGFSSFMFWGWVFGVKNLCFGCGAGFGGFSRVIF